MIRPMLCGIYKEGKVPFPCYVQPKLDGVRCLLTNNHAYTRNQKPHKDHIQKLLSGINRWKDVTFDGELMLKGGAFQQTVSAVKKDYKELTQKLKYCVYDYVGRENESFHDRMCDMNIIVPLIPPIIFVRTVMVHTQEELDDQHNEFICDGYEGSIIRDLHQPYLPGSRKAMWKRKDFKDAEFTIVGFEEGEGKNAGTPVFKCSCNSSGDSTHVFGCVPMGTYDKKRKMWEDRDSLIGRMMTVRYQELTDDGVPRFPVGVEIRDYE